MKTKKVLMLLLAMFCVAGAWAQLDTSKKYTIANRNDLGVFMQDNGVDVVALGAENENSYWALIPTGKTNCYYVRNTVTGKYIQSCAVNLQEVAMGETPVEFYIEAKAAEGEGMYGMASTDQATYNFTDGTIGLNWKSKADTGREFDTVQGFAAVAGTNHRSFWKLAAKDEPVFTVENLSTYTGAEPLVFNQADNKFYALNNIGEYEVYGVYPRVNTLSVARMGVTEIEYIKTNSSMGSIPYINLNYIPKKNSRAVATINALEGGDWKAAYGCGYFQGGWKDRFCFFTTNAVIDLGGETGNKSAMRYGEKIVTVLDAALGTLKVYEADGVTEIGTVTDSPKSDDCKTPLYVFAQNKDVPGGDKITDCYNPLMTLYGLDLYEGETLVMNLVPAVDAEGNAGLYDKIGKKMYTSANSGKFEIPASAEALVADAGITVYEGKRVIKDGVEYKYSNGEWVNCGAPTMAPFANGDYKNLNNWTTNNDHKGVFEGKIAYDEGAGTNALNPYVGTGGWEPLYYKLEGFTKGGDYNVSFKYSGTAWNSWNDGSYAFLPFNVLNNENFGHDNFYPSVGGGILVSAHLPKAETTNMAVSEDFTAEQEFEMLLIQFGVVNDGDKGFHFNFDNILIQQYQYADEYPELSIEVKVTPTRYDADGIGYMPFTGGEGWGDAPFANFVDNDANTKFGGSSAAVWAVVVATEPVAVKQYSIVTGGDTYAYSDRNPRSWKVEGSNDNKNWTLIDEQVDDHSIALVSREEFVFPVNDATKYKYFKFTTTRGVGGGTQIGEFWINEQNHTWGSEPITTAEAVQPTCLQKGDAIYECSDCHALKRVADAVDALDHDFVDGVCSRCGMGEKDVELLPNGQAHPYVAKYRWATGSDNAVDIEAGWTDPDFDDSAWGDLVMPIGSAGYDNGAHNGARYNTNWYDEYNTYWLRRTFNLDAPFYGKFQIKVLHDDDYAVFVNGTKVAEAAGWTDGTDWQTVDVDPTLLRAGKNVVAIYQEQNFGGAYHDLSFMGTPVELVFDEAIDNAAQVTLGTTTNATEISINRSVVADTWNTIVLPFDLTQAQIEEAFGEGAHVAAVNAPETDEEAIAFKTVEGMVAGKSYLLWPTKTIAATEPVKFTGVTMTDPTLAEDAVGADMEYVFTGSFNRVAPTKYDYFVAANNELKKNADDTKKLKAFRAYFKDTRTHLPVGDDGIDDSGDILAKRFTVDGQGTGIIFQNGDVETIGNIYTISGQKADKLQKGIYVVNGKKVIVK